MILISKELKKYVLGQGLGFLRLMTLNFQAKKSFKHHGQCISFSYQDGSPFPFGKALVSEMSLRLQFLKSKRKIDCKN